MMGVYIKDMKMLSIGTYEASIDATNINGKTVISLFARGEGGLVCCGVYEAVFVLPHGRLIDADEAKNKIRPWSPEDETNGCTFDTVKKLMHKLLNDTPTVIPAEEGE